VTERLINPKGTESGAPNGTSPVYHIETHARPFPIDPDQKLMQVLLKFLVRDTPTACTKLSPNVTLAVHQQQDAAIGYPRRSRARQDRSEYDAATAFWYVAILVTYRRIAISNRRPVVTI
jgi:hypothetical protein